MADIRKDQERDELHRAIWAIADGLRGSVDGWDFKSYVLGMMFYRYISENLTNYINEGEIEAGNEGFDYALLSDEDAEQAREDMVKTKGFFILPSELFCNLRKKAAGDENLNMTLETIFKNIEDSAKGSESEDNFAGLFDDIDVNSNKLGATVAKRNANLVKLIEGVAAMKLGNYKDIAELLQKYPLGQPIIGEQNKKDFIVLFGNILRLRNILSAFDRFAGNEILSPIDFQDYTGTYHDVYDEIKPKPGSKDSIMDDVVFEMELVKQVEVNIDYILMLVAKYHDGNCEDKEILVAIDKAIKSSLQLRSKKELIENFIATVNTKTDVNADWQRFVKEQRETDIQTLIAEEKLKPEETRKFVENAFRDGVLKTTGTDVDRLMPPVSRFGGGGSRDKKKQTVIEKLKAFFEKYFGLVNAGESFAEGSNK